MGASPSIERLIWRGVAREKGAEAREAKGRVARSTQDLFRDRSSPYFIFRGVAT